VCVCTFPWAWTFIAPSLPSYVEAMVGRSHYWSIVRWTWRACVHFRCRFVLSRRACGRDHRSACSVWDVRTCSLHCRTCYWILILRSCPTCDCRILQSFQRRSGNRVEKEVALGVSSGGMGARGGARWGKECWEPAYLDPPWDWAFLGPASLV